MRCGHHLGHLPGGRGEDGGTHLRTTEPPEPGAWQRLIAWLPNVLPVQSPWGSFWKHAGSWSLPREATRGVEQGSADCGHQPRSLVYRVPVTYGCWDYTGGRGDCVEQLPLWSDSWPSLKRLLSGPSFADCWPGGICFTFQKALVPDQVRELLMTICVLLLQRHKAGSPRGVQRGDVTGPRDQD